MSDLHNPERDAFEAWLNPKFHAGNVSKWVYPGRYENDTHALAWLAWNKRAELALASDARIAELEAENAALKRGESICAKCGLRQDSTNESNHNF